jgi:outer membrane protein TolC
MKPRLLHARGPLRGRFKASFSALLLASLCAQLASAQTQSPAPNTGANPSQTPAAPAQPNTRPQVGQLSEPPNSATQSEFERRLSVMLAGNGLRADDVAKRAVQNSYAIAAKRRSLEAVDASVSQAQAEFWPQLLLQARYTRMSEVTTQDLSGGGGFVAATAPGPNGRAFDPVADAPIVTSFTFPVVLNNYALQASLTVPLSDYLLRTSNAVGAAKHSRAAAEKDEQATRLSVAREGRVSYYEWIRALGQQIVTSQGIQLSQGRLQDTQNSFQAGLASRADVLRAEAGVKSSQLLDERAKHALVIAQLRLRVLMRDDAGASYEVGENLLADLPELDKVPEPEAAYREALGQRPEILQLQESEASLKAQASVSSAGNYPRLEAVGNLLYANPNQRYFPLRERWDSSWDVGLVLSWTPTDIPGAQAASSVAEARAAETAAQRGALEDSLRVEVNDAIEAMKEASFALGVTEAGLRAAEEGYRVRRELFRAGRSTLVELTDAEAELTRARIEAVNARVNSRLAIVALNYALGRDTTR